MVSWDGPWNLEEAQGLGAKDGNGLYLVVGRLKGESLRRALYCGITERSFAQRLKEHNSSGRFKDVSEGEVWFGTLNFPHRLNRSHLLRAEMMMIQSTKWNLTLNVRGKVALPSPTCVVMRWYFPLQGEKWRSRSRRPLFAKSKPDVLWSEPGGDGIDLQWSACLKHSQTS